MRIWSTRRVAFAAGADVRREFTSPAGGGPERVIIDSRLAGPGDLFVGLAGEHADGGQFAVAALEAGAWGVIVSPAFADSAASAGGDGAVLVASDPLQALGELASAWRRDLAAHVVGVTGSVGKTTTKDLLAAMLRPHRRVVASRANFNTEIGMPLEILSAPPGTDTLVLEMAMRGAGQIAELARIATPDVGLVTNIGPVHLEQLGSLDNIARAKGELLEALPSEGAAVIPLGEPLLRRLVAEGADVITFGSSDEADVHWLDDGVASVLGEVVEIELPDAYRAEHLRTNALAALGAAAAIGVRVSGRIEATLAALHGERVRLAMGAVAIDDCYNANPLSMAAALRELGRAELPADAPGARRLAVLGDMLELGPDELDHHRRLGHLATSAGVEIMVTVGSRAAAALDAFDGEQGIAVADAAEAAAVLEDLLQRGDLVLVKGSRGVGLEAVCAALREVEG